LKRLLFALIAALLIAAILPQVSVLAQSTTKLTAVSDYELNRYGYAVVDISVTAKYNGTGTIQWPGAEGIGIGLGGLSTDIVGINVTGGYQWSNSSANGVITVTGSTDVASGSSATFGVTAVLNGVVSHAVNGSLEVNVLTSPYISTGVSSLVSVISMPDNTVFAVPPHSFGTTSIGTATNYTRTQTNVAAPTASVTTSLISQSALQDFHPLKVYSATRVISVGDGGNPVVEDRITFANLGTTSLSTLYVSPLTSSTAAVTMEPASQPPLFNPSSVALQNDGIDLTRSKGYPPAAGANYTILYRYPLAQKYYTVSGGTVTLSIPQAPPIPTFVQSYSFQLSVPAGTSVTSGTTSMTYSNVSPYQSGTLGTGYSLSLGWALDAGVPLASAIFAVLLFALFVSRTKTTEEEETEEESATERASAMIKAFEDKTSLINQILAEVPSIDPNDRTKVYFDGLRSRLDSYRSRALQRLNEVKQKSTTQKFFDLLNELHTTEREVDRAAKDTINLYEQYYTNRMRKDVFDRLLPTYRKRLEKALDQLSEELHVAQREAKLL
jgi:hypothetical protein